MQRLPVLIITGFLGAGKTTFLNWLLSTHPDLHISVIVNEFGEIALESQFVKKQTDTVVELANGCMCCVARSDIPRVVRYVREHSPATEFMLIEASGLSDPDPILETLQTGELAESLRLDGILCIVDVLNFERYRPTHPIVNSQIADADVVILSKVKEAGQEQTTKVKNLLLKLRSDLRILEWNSNLEPSLFLDTAEPLHQAVESETTPELHHQQHDPAMQQWLTTDKPVALPAIEQLLRHLPAAIIRAKGVLSTTDGQKVLLQFVGGRYTLEPAEWQSGEKHQTTILCLGTSFDERELDELWAAALA